MTIFHKNHYETPPLHHAATLVIMKDFKWFTDCEVCKGPCKLITAIVLAILIALVMCLFGCRSTSPDIDAAWVSPTGSSQADLEQSMHTIEQINQQRGMTNDN